MRMPNEAADPDCLEIETENESAGVWPDCHYSYPADLDQRVRMNQPKGPIYHPHSPSRSTES
jgi:hypothetical protein